MILLMVIMNEGRCVGAKCVVEGEGEVGTGGSKWQGEAVNRFDTVSFFQGSNFIC